MEVKDYVQRLNEILDKKHIVLKEILSFTRLQKEAVSKEDYNELEVLIARKQERIEAVDKLDEQFSVYILRLKTMLSISSLEELPRFNIPGTADLKHFVDKIIKTLEEIRLIDEENTDSVKSELISVKEKIKQSNSLKKVNRAYNSPLSGQSAYYFDKKK